MRKMQLSILIKMIEAIIIIELVAITYYLITN